jgi:Tol biopolymer transport system component
MNARSSGVLALLIACALARSAAAACTAAPPAPRTYALPALTGHLAFDSRNVDTQSPLYDQSSLYLYTFSTGALQALGASWGITQARNPDLSADGKWMTFTGVQNGHWEVFVWKLGAALPINLTLNMAATRSEDPKFSLDEKSIIFKQDGNIRRMILGVDAKQNLVVQSVQNITTGGNLLNSYAQASAPFLSADGATAYYFRGTSLAKGYPPFLYSTSLKTMREQQVAHPGFTAEYYPVVNYDSASAMLVSVANTPAQIDSKGNGYDQIVVRYGTGGAIQLSLNDCNHNNSDPTAISASLIIFSSDRLDVNHIDGRFELYLANVNTGLVWSLPSSINKAPNALEGASYSAN